MDVAEWMRAVLSAIGGKVMMGPPKPTSNGSAEGSGRVVLAAVAADADDGHYPLKDKVCSRRASAYGTPTIPRPRNEVHSLPG